MGYGLEGDGVDVKILVAVMFNGAIFTFTFSAYGKAPQVIDLGRNEVNSKVRQPRLMTVRGGYEREQAVNAIYRERFLAIEARWLKTRVAGEKP